MWVVLLAFALALGVGNAQLQIVDVGTGAAGQVLTDGAVVCPSDFANGFTVLCVASGGSTEATFLLNGIPRRTDTEAPYYFRDDTGGVLMQWNQPPRRATITCEQNDGTVDTVFVSFQCGVPAAQPGEMYIYEAGVRGQRGPKVVDGLSFCPSDFPSSRFNVFCASSAGATTAKFFINDVLVKTQVGIPYFIAGDRGEAIFSWRTFPPGPFSIRCELDDAGSTSTSASNVIITCPPKYDPVPVESPEDGGFPGVIVTPAGCIVIDATQTALSAGWTVEGDGVTFKSGDNSRDLEARGVSPLSYDFIPPVTSQYAYVMDMTTRGAVRHNDVWVRIRGGWRFTRDGRTRVKKGTGWFKMYHNRRRRAIATSALSSQASAVSTARTLQAGVADNIRVSGRSTKVTLHNIVMFPCEGVTCDRRNRLYRDRLAVCSALLEWI